MPTPLSTITPVPAYGPIPAAAPSEPQTPVVPSSPAAPVAAAVRVSRGAGHNTFGVPERVRRSVEDLHRRVDALERGEAAMSGDLGGLADRIGAAESGVEALAGRIGAVEDGVESERVKAELLRYYPDGSVTDPSQITQGLAFDYDDTTMTCLCSPFLNSSFSSANKNIAGRVVIPYEVERKNHNGEKMKYTVVGIAGLTADEDEVIDSEENTILTGVVAPATVESIGSGVFYDCTALASFSAPSVKTVGRSAFAGCSALGSADFPSATTVGDYSFSGCSGLNGASFPNLVTAGQYAFSSARLVSAEFPKLASAGRSVFSNSNYPNPVLPSLVSVSDYAFSGSRTLKSVFIPGAASVGAHAFRSCTSLADITLRYGSPITHDALVAAGVPDTAAITYIYDSDPEDNKSISAALEAIVDAVTPPESDN